jgi:hypothetical protein
LSSVGAQVLAVLLLRLIVLQLGILHPHASSFSMNSLHLGGSLWAGIILRYIFLISSGTPAYGFWGAVESPDLAVWDYLVLLAVNHTLIALVVVLLIAVIYLGLIVLNVAEKQHEQAKKTKAALRKTKIVGQLAVSGVAQPQQQQPNQAATEVTVTPTTDGGSKCRVCLVSPVSVLLRPCSLHFKFFLV